MNNILNIFTDGGARGNPGPAAIGVHIEDEKGDRIAGFGKKIGHATNNTAEYRAVSEALEWIVENEKEIRNYERINFFLDSNLVCSQINGIFKVKNSDLRTYLFKVKQLETQIKLPIHYSHIPREENTKADNYVNQALDSNG